MPTNTDKILFSKTVVSVQGHPTCTGMESPLRHSHVATGLLCSPGVALVAVPAQACPSEFAHRIGSGHRLLAGRRTGTADALFDAPIKRASVFRFKDKDTDRSYVGVELKFDTKRWKLAGSGFDKQELAMADNADELDSDFVRMVDERLKAAKRPTEDWFDQTEKAHANDSGSLRPLPFVRVLPAGDSRKTSAADKRDPFRPQHYGSTPPRNPFAWLFKKSGK